MERRAHVAAYGVAVGSVAVGAALPAVSALWSGSGSLLLLAAVLVSALYGGIGPGLLATLLAGAASASGVWPVSRAPHELADVGRLATFCAIGVAISGVGDALLRATAERQRLREREQTSARAVELARQALTETEARAAATVKAALDAIVIIGHEGRIIEFNPAAERTFGYRRDEATGRLLADLIIPPTLRAQHRAGFARYLAGGESQILGRRVELTAMRSDGSEIPVELTVVAIQREGQPVFTGFLRDITALKEAEQTQRRDEERLRAALEVAQQARAEAEEASRLKDEFLATVSHELRTPLTAMMAWVAALRRPQVGSERKAQALDVLERSAQTQAKLVDDLLDVSRIVTGRMRLDLRPVDLVMVIDAALAAVRPAAEAKGIRIAAALQGDVGHVAGDGERLQQVVWNLVSNAIKFTPAGGQVTIALAHRNRHAQIVVSDTGRGIRADFLPHVFDAFRQADAGAASKRQGGMGLGLTIVRQLVELHGGTVEVSSDGEGQGTTFTVTLPLAPLTARDSTAA